MGEFTNITNVKEDLMNDNYENWNTVLSDDERVLFEIVNFVFICSLICIFGMTANIINIIIFYKQGFTNTVNIGFFGLAVSDLCCLASLQWASICMNPLLISSQVPWFPVEVMYLTASWPHMCFSRITSFITVYITSERYLSIALPLKVKQIITPKKTTIIICCIYLINIIALVPEYATSYLDWRFVPSRNMTLIAIMFTNSRNKVVGLVYALHSFLGMSSFIGLIISTTLLVTTLGRNTRWRKEITSSSNQSTSLSKRDQKTVKMVILIAVILIVCYTPGVIISVATVIVGSEFGIKGKYTNICESMWSLAVCVQAINSSINIFLYYIMSSKYKETFHKLCGSTSLQVLD